MSDISSSFFRVERDGSVVHLSMSRPDKANSMTPDFWSELPRLIGEFEQDETVRALVLTGEGRHFTGGMDLAAFADIAKLFEREPGRAAFAMRETILRLQGSFNAVERARFPVIAAIHGACLGGGIDLITACDIRIASADAYFAIEEINIGMAADVGTLQRLPKLISPAIAAELAYTGRRFDATEAKAFGLVSGIYDNRDILVHEAMTLARSIARKSPLAIAGIKRNLAYSRDHSIADGLDYIATWNGGMLRSADLIGAVRARMAKAEATFADLLGPDDTAGIS